MSNGWRTPNYDVDPARAAGFYPVIRSYFPQLPDNALQPAYAGVRPKISGRRTRRRFPDRRPECHGIPGLVNFFGIEPRPHLKPGHRGDRGGETAPIAG